MFKVPAESLEQYLAFDPRRRGDLEALDALISTSAPSLTRYFHAGTPAGQPGMRFKMIGYGPLFYAAQDGKPVEWPAIGVALQKNYVSVYFAPAKDGRPVTEAFRGRLGELRAGDGNFSFKAFSDLDRDAVSELVSEAERLFRHDRSSMSRFNLVTLDGGPTR